MRAAVLLGAFCIFAAVIPETQRQPQSTVSDGIAQDSVVVKKVLKAVRVHVLSLTKDRRRPLVVREGKKSRRFMVVDFLTPVSKTKSVYTAQVDADEYDHKIPRILYVDVKLFKGTYRVTRIRIGPNRFRN